MNVGDNVAYGLMVRKVPKTDRARRVGEALRMVRLEGYEARKPNQLSGGQRQRVALARALVNRPRVLLLDEPLGALDLKLREEMQIELKSIQQQVGITFIYVTHDQEEALTMSDRLAVFNAGRIEQIGAPAEVYERPATRFVAGFVGTSNVLRGEVARAITGEDGTFIVRPEKIHLAWGEARPAPTTSSPRAPSGKSSISAPIPGISWRSTPASELVVTEQNLVDDFDRRAGPAGQGCPPDLEETALPAASGGIPGCRRSRRRPRWFVIDRCASRAFCSRLSSSRRRARVGRPRRRARLRAQPPQALHRPRRRAPPQALPRALHRASDRAHSAPVKGSSNLAVWPYYVVGGTGGEQISGAPDWVTPFEQKTGCKVKAKVYGGSSDAVALMKTGEYDGGAFSGDATLRLIAAGDVAACEHRAHPQLTPTSSRASRARATTRSTASPTASPTAVAPTSSCGGRTSSSPTPTAGASCGKAAASTPAR